MKDNFVTNDQAIMSKAINYNNFLYSLVAPYVKGDILEIGSGIGNMTRMLLKSDEINNVSSISCIESDNACIKQLEIIKEQSKTPININEGYFPTVKTDKQKYDLIFHFNVLEHIEDDEYAIKKSKDLLASEGILFMYVPAFQFLYGSMDKKLKHNKRYNKKDLSKILERYNFKIIKARYHNIIGFLGWLINNRIIKITEQKKGQVGFFDKILLPMQIKLEKIINFPFGQNLLIVSKQKK